MVYVYTQNVPNKTPIIYSSINKAMKALGISYGILLECINNKHIYKDNLALSFEPLLIEDLSNYTKKPAADSQIRNNLIFFNEEGEPGFEFQSGREMARFFNIDAKKARTLIKKGAYLNFTIVNKPVYFRKEVFVFDSQTYKLVTRLDSITSALNYAKVGFYTMKHLLQTNEAYNGQIFSYNKTLRQN